MPDPPPVAATVGFADAVAAVLTATAAVVRRWPVAAHGVAVAGGGAVSHGGLLGPAGR